MTHTDPTPYEIAAFKYLLPIVGLPYWVYSKFNDCWEFDDGSGNFRSTEELDRYDIHAMEGAASRELRQGHASMDAYWNITRGSWFLSGDDKDDYFDTRIEALAAAMRRAKEAQ